MSLVYTRYGTKQFVLFTKQKTCFALTCMAQLLKHHPIKQKVTDLIRSQGT